MIQGMQLPATVRRMDSPRHNVAHHPLHVDRNATRASQLQSSGCAKLWNFLPETFPLSDTL